ncbi:MAG: hypothetical protein GYA21_05780 [Myxococcales bacterium]|nr:hypothetical protein [Myxococcales bacterium]
MYVGFWDIDQNRPAVMRHDVSGGEWEYACGGPVPLDGVNADESANASFLFRQDQTRSVIGFNASLLPPEELVMFVCDGGAWQRLPSVPLQRLPGFTAGFTSLAEQNFTFTARDGHIYAVTNSEEGPSPDDNTCLSVFVHDGTSWGLAPQRMCYPAVGFGYQKHHSEVTVVPSPSGALYVGSFLYDWDSGENASNVYRKDAAGWTRLTDDAFAPVTGAATTEFSLAVTQDGEGERVVAAIGGLDNRAHVFTHAASQWTELPSPGVRGSPNQILPLNVARWPDRAFLACWDGGLFVKRFDGQQWQNLGEPDFYDDVDSIFIDNILAADDQNLYLVYRTKHSYPGKQVASLSVYRHPLP